MIADVEPGTSPQAKRVSDSVDLSVVSNSRLLGEGLEMLLAKYLSPRLLGIYAGDPGPRPGMPNPPGHVVLLDGSMEREKAVSWVRYWRRADPAAQVVAMELTDSADVILACIEAGATGYTLRGASARDLARAIEAARRGIANCAPELTAKLFARLAELRAKTYDLPLTQTPLTRRELAVLRYVAADYSNQEIATTLVIEVRTVKHHVHNILEKLGVRRRRDAARLAVDQGWIRPG